MRGRQLQELTPEIEPNGDAPTATGPLVPHALIQGAIVPGDDLDYFAVVLDATSDLYLETFDGDGPGSCVGVDTVLSLHGTNGLSTLAYKDSGGLGQCSRVDPASDPGARHLPARVHAAGGQAVVGERTPGFGEIGHRETGVVVEQLDGGAHDTLMIGDGINDALAFCAAACAGTPAIDRPTLPARADFYFAGVGIGPISETLRTAHYLRRVIVRNMGLAALYNSVVLGLSFAGLMTPLRCALAMPISSLLMIAVTVYSFREPGEGAQHLLRSNPERPAQTSRPGGSPASLALAEGVSS